jgi:hypothetical protein
MGGALRSEGLRQMEGRRCGLEAVPAKFRLASGTTIDQGRLSVGMCGFEIGDRVLHAKRISETLRDTGEGAVVNIAPDRFGAMAVHVHFDWVGKNRQPSMGIYDEAWFAKHPETLKKI